MKVFIDDEEQFTIKEFQKNVIKNDIPSEIFDEDMKKRIFYIINHKYQQCFKRLKEHWEPILKDRYKNLPTDEEELANVIFSQPDYQDRTKRDIEQFLSFLRKMWIPKLEELKKIGEINEIPVDDIEFVDLILKQNEADEELQKFSEKLKKTRGLK